MFHLWWERIGESRASGIMKLMLSEVRNFPEIAEFYANEVIRPTERLLSQLLARGIARNEFRPVNVVEVVHALIAPMLFLVMHKHSIGACGVGRVIEPKAFIAAQIDMVLHGLERPRKPAATKPAKAVAAKSPPAPRLAANKGKKAR